MIHKYLSEVRLNRIIVKYQANLINGYSSVIIINIIISDNQVNINIMHELQVQGLLVLSMLEIWTGIIYQHLCLTYKINGIIGIYGFKGYLILLMVISL